MSKWTRISAYQVSALPDVWREILYVLYVDGVLVYIGQTKYPRRRLLSHLRKDILCKDQWELIQIKYRDCKNLDKAERMLTKRINPVRNIRNRFHPPVLVGTKKPKLLPLPPHMAHLREVGKKSHRWDRYWVKE